MVIVLDINQNVGEGRRRRSGSGSSFITSIPSRLE